jgi:Nitrile hydratase, alpha chain
MNRDFEYQWGRIVARAWGDPAFKATLLADPAAALEEYGLLPPVGLEIKVVENTDKVVHLTLPRGPGP